MFSNFIEKKYGGQELTQAEYYEVVDKFVQGGVSKDSIKFFLSLNSFGMTKKEVLYFARALRDSGKVFSFDECVFEKHSTGGVGDPSSVVLVPLIASLGYKIIKSTAKSFMFMNGSADRFGAFPGFKVTLNDDAITTALDRTNACVLSHDEIVCPADKLLYDVREMAGIEGDINLLAASIAAKKLASGANVVLVDIKYGHASVVRDYDSAKELAGILKYVFDKSNVKSIIVITNTLQTIGDGIGNAVEAVDALEVLQGRHCLLRDVCVEYATLMIMAADKKIKRKDVEDVVKMALDNGSAYNRLLQIIKWQGGDMQVVKESKVFMPYKSVNFIADRDGFVGSINSLLLGELIRRLCADSHDDHIGAILRVKIGQEVKKGDVIVSFYYKDDADFERYKNAIAGCVRITSEKIFPVDVIKKVIN